MTIQFGYITSDGKYFTDQLNANNYLENNSTANKIITYQEGYFKDNLIYTPPNSLPYKINNSYQNPRNIDFSILGYAKERSIIDGELLSIKHYKNSSIDPITGVISYSDLVLEEKRSYTRDVYGLVIYRILTIDYYLTDDTIGLTYVSDPRYYTFREKLIEIRTRRTNIINSVSEYVFYTLGFTNAKDLLSKTEEEQDEYIKGVEGSPLENKIQSMTETYLTQAIKDTIVDMLDYLN